MSPKQKDHVIRPNEISCTSQKIEHVPNNFRPTYNHQGFCQVSPLVSHGFPMNFQIRCLEAGRNLSARPATTKTGSRTGGLNMVTSTCPETCTIFVYIVNNYIYIYVYIYMDGILYSMCMHACMDGSMYVCMCVCVHVCMCACVDVWMCVCVYVCMCV